MAEDIVLEIAAIKFALRSFAHYDNEGERIFFLRGNFVNTPHLDTYFRFNEEKLQSLLQEKEQQRTGDKLLYVNSFDLYPFHSNLKARSWG